MTTLFDPLDLGAMQLKNRVVMAPLTRCRSPHNIPTQSNVLYYRQRASAGLIISEGTNICAGGRGFSDVPCVFTQEQRAHWKAVTDGVHEEGGKIVAQIWHVGRASHVSLQPENGAPVAPSAIEAKASAYIRNSQGLVERVAASPARALEREEIKALVETYATAAKNAVNEAGFDGVEIHGANGYLIDQFLRDSANQREDEYGGSIENRARFGIEVATAVAAAIGGERVGIRISPLTGVNDMKDSQPQQSFEYFVRALAPLNLAYIHVLESDAKGHRDFEGQFDYKKLKQAHRDSGGQAKWMVNNGYDGDMAAQAVASGYADMVAFGRPFIANPDLVHRLKDNLALNALDFDTLYNGGDKGYIDYPFAKS